jgi:serine/threonine protein kinase
MSSDTSLVAGRYRLESVLGQGGMGTVWTGRDELLGRQVAIKEVRIPPGLSERDREVLHRRMMREARLTAQLNDPRIITVYDAVLHDGRPFIVMEHVPSRSLDQELDQSGPLPPQRVAEIGLELLAALDLARAARRRRARGAHRLRHRHHRGRRRTDLDRSAGRVSDVHVAGAVAR